MYGRTSKEHHVFFHLDWSLHPFMNHIDADRALSSNHRRARRLVFIESMEPAGTRFATLETSRQQSYIQLFVQAWDVLKDACLFDILTLPAGLKFNTFLN